MVDTAREKLIEAIDESFDALLDAAKATEARGHKVTGAVLDGAKEGEQEFVELVRKWTAAPTNFLENFSAMLEAQTRAQQRALDIVRDSFGGAGDYTGELQEAMRKMVRANADAARATVELARDAYTRVREGQAEEAQPARKSSRATRVPIAAGADSGKPEGD